MNPPRLARDVGAANLRFARALVGELHAAGVVAAVVCPGSRSTPLALAIAEHPALSHSVHLDERSAAFFALGYAKAAGRPVALLCTSGTAGANFLPAVAEAHHARVPLIVLTADRPPELRAWGAAQTMEQRGLYAAFTRWFEEAPCPAEREGEEAYALALARRAVSEATGPAAGPVHLNLPFREPLAPAVYEPIELGAAGETLEHRTSDGVSHVTAGDDSAGALLRHTGSPTASSDRPNALPRSLPTLQGEPVELARELRRVERGVLLFGPDTWDSALAAAAHALATALDWPVLADPASGLRAGAPAADVLIHGADLLLREPSVAQSLAPQLVVRFGGPPTSAALNAWLAEHASADTWLVDPAAGFRDPQHRARRMFRTTARQFCEFVAAGLQAGAATPATAAATDPALHTNPGATIGARASDASALVRKPNVANEWHALWRRADRIAREAATAALDAESGFLTPQLARALWTALPDGAALYAANSMAVRDIDSFAGPRIATLRLLANRGVNGIDGLVSAALGAAVAARRPVVLWCGDLALLHDVSGLLDGRLQDADLTIVVSNDDGGGIFEYLAVAQAVPRELFERVFAVPHGIDLCEVARGFGWNAVRATTDAAFTQALSHALAGGRHVIEVPVDRATNTAFHRLVHEQVRAALQQEFFA